jgi:hypothetical protein
MKNGELYLVSQSSLTNSTPKLKGDNKMSQTPVNFIVVNSTAGPISGTAYHHSGSGPDSRLTPLDVPPLNVLNASKSANTIARSNHDDYWSWVPTKNGTNGSETQVQLNVHSSQQVVLIVTETLLVVVTSKREKVREKELVEESVEELAAS